MANFKERKSSSHNVRMKISPGGVAEDGSQCYWTGFDKVRDEFWGKPKKPNMNQSSKRGMNIFRGMTVESSQK